jgi:broad specificity phosphatase PhoE
MAVLNLRHLILVRHAHRDNSLRSEDNGLSELGQAQTLKLSQNLQSRFDLSNCIWDSSPKKRCIETIAPLAMERLQISELLDEQKSGESFADFDERISSYLTFWQKSLEPLRIACSHGDWIPEATLKLTGLRVDLGKSGYALFSLDAQGKVTLQDLLLTADLLS